LAKIAATFASTGSPAFLSIPVKQTRRYGHDHAKRRGVSLSNSGETEEISLILSKTLDIPLIAMSGNTIPPRASGQCTLDTSVEKEACR